MTTPPTPALHVLLNVGSGSHADAHADLHDALQACGRPYRLVPLRNPGLARQVRRAVQDAQAAGALVVAAGGDGTINAVAQEAATAGCPMGVLPRGTFNYFCREHGIAADMPTALQQLLQGQPRTVRAGRVNGRLFLVNASVGLYPQLLEDREAFKARLGRSRAVASVAALHTLLSHPIQLTLKMQSGTEELVRKTPTLFIGNNALQLRQTGLVPTGTAEPIGPDHLHAVLLNPVSTPRLLLLAVLGAFGKLGEAREDVLQAPFQTLQVRARGHLGGRRIKVATDGEVQWMHLPLRFEVVPAALTLIAPRPDMALEPA